MEKPVASTLICDTKPSAELLVGNKSTHDDANPSPTGVDAVEKVMKLSESEATDSEPEMDGPTAENTLSSLAFPQDKSKKPSDYMRFKSKLLQHAKDCEKKKVAKEISIVARVAWNLIKNVSSNIEASSLTFKEVPGYADDLSPSTCLLIKCSVDKDLANEKAALNTQLSIFRGKFLPASVTYLNWKSETIHLNEYPVVRQTVEKLKLQAGLAYGRRTPDKFDEALDQLSSKLGDLREEYAVQELAEKLKSSTTDQLQAHSKEHLQALKQLEQMGELKAKLANFEKEKAASEMGERMQAISIQSSIISGLRKQMVYTNSSLKRKWKRITLRVDRVNQKMFETAFQVPAGSRQAIIYSRDVGTKSLRYGSMVCNDVIVKLSGSSITASTTYGI